MASWAPVKLNPTLRTTCLRQHDALLDELINGFDEIPFGLSNVTLAQ